MTAASPSRIQRKRTKGWRMPAGARYVGRPTIWGNPFPIDVYGRDKAVGLYRDWLEHTLSADDRGGLSRGDIWSDPGRFVSLPTLRTWLLERVPELRGLHLACYCAAGAPCHADVLLELANR